MNYKVFSIMTVLCLSISCNTPRKFQCPMKNARIIFIERKGAEMLKPSSTVKISGETKDVYSSSKGVANLIDSVSNRFEIFIYSKEYTFIYHNLTTTFIKKGDKIKKGQYLGRVLDTDSLEVSIIKNGVPYMPNIVLKCPIKYVYEQ